MKVHYIPFGFEYFTMGSTGRRLFSAFETALEENDTTRISALISQIKRDKNSGLYFGALLVARQENKTSEMALLLTDVPKEAWLYGVEGDQLPFYEISQYTLTCVRPTAGAPAIFENMRITAEDKAVSALTAYFKAGCPTSLRNQLNTTLLSRAVATKSVKIVQTVLDADRTGERYFYEHPAYALPAYLESVQNNTPEISKLLETTFCFDKTYTDIQQAVLHPPVKSADSPERNETALGPVGSVFALGGIVALMLCQCHASSPEKAKKDESTAALPKPTVVAHHKPAVQPAGIFYVQQREE